MRMAGLTSDLINIIIMICMRMPTSTVCVHVTLFVDLMLSDKMMPPCRVFVPTLGVGISPYIVGCIMGEYAKQHLSEAYKTNLF